MYRRVARRASQGQHVDQPALAFEVSVFPTVKTSTTFKSAFKTLRLIQVMSPHLNSFHVPRY